MNASTKEVADAFNEWARRYAENPNEFSEILDENGVPYADYGERCASYLAKLLNEARSKV